jgi:hypothetical protein
MEEYTKIKYGRLADALRIKNQGQGAIGYLHHQSKMYIWEQDVDILPHLKDWKIYLKENQDIQVFYNYHKDLGKDILRVHLVYQPNEVVQNPISLEMEPKLVSIFSCNLENLLEIYEDNLAGLNIQEPSISLKKIPYLQSREDLSENEKKMSEELISEFVKLQLK